MKLLFTEPPAHSIECAGTWDLNTTKLQLECDTCDAIAIVDRLALEKYLSRVAINESLMNFAPEKATALLIGGQYNGSVYLLEPSETLPQTIAIGNMRYERIELAVSDANKPLRITYAAIYRCNSITCDEATDQLLNTYAIYA